MFNTERKKSKVKLRSFFKMVKFQKTNIIEENPLKVTELIVPSFSIETFSLK